MHGLINRAIQCFLRDTYGDDLWSRVARTAGLDFDNFEAMLSYDLAITDAVIDAAAAIMARPRDSVLEDLGTYLVTHPQLAALRRLLRFGGPSFADFLHSLEDLPGRGRLALPDLELPQLDLLDLGAQEFTLYCRAAIAGAGHVVVGLLRGMADDYGALVLLDYRGRDDLGEEISIRLLDSAHAEARPFRLAMGAR